MKTLTLLAVILVSVPAAAQSTGDARWAPWVGCWDLLTDASRDASQSTRPRDRLRPRSQADEGPRVCVTPSADGGATFQTTTPGQASSEQRMVPNAVEQPLTQTDCRGTQRAEWSQDGLRLFARANVTCSGDEGPRSVAGITLLAPDGTWLDIQSVQVASRESVRVRRYRRQAGAPGSPRPSVAASRLTLDDVKEAIGKVPPRALEAALVETNAGFDLRGRDLVDLDEAGVPDSVVDLIVALSYPERFVVERTARADAGPVPFMYGVTGAGSAFSSPLWWDDFGFYSSAYGYYSPYYYSPLGYSYSRGFDPRFLNGGYFYPIGIGDGGGGVADPQPSGAGRVVDGQGYTRVRPRETAAAEATRQSGGGSGGTTSTASAATSSSSGSGSSSSGGGSVSPQGASSGGSGGDAGRTAQPR